MASQNEYSMMFQLAASLDGSYSKTFATAQSALTGTQIEIQSLQKTQADIAAYTKQQAAIQTTTEKLKMLQAQHDNIQAELAQTDNASSALQNRLLSKQLQVERTTSALQQQSAQLDATSARLQEAGVDTQNLTAEQARLQTEVSTLRQTQVNATQSMQSFGTTGVNAITQVQQALMAAGIVTAMKSIATATYEASVSFESGMTGVDKTTNLTAQELAELTEQVKTLATDIPVTVEELTAIGETAGQLGIAKDGLLDFTETMAMLATATTMTADEGATLLAQYANVTGMAQDAYDNLGATVVALGNNFATTEQKIMDMAQGISSTGALTSMSEADMLGISAAVSSLGIEAEMGGTAVSKLITELMLATETGEGLAGFAEIANMTADEFTQKWGEDAAGALTAFISGLSDAERLGGSAVQVLQEMDITETRMRNTVLSLSNAGDVLGNALTTANTAWAENSALVQEAEKRYATTESQQILLENSFNNLKIAVGDNFTPALRDLYAAGADVLGNMTDFVELNPALVKGTATFAGVLGSVYVGLVAYTQAAKLVASANALMTASIPGAGVILGVTAAVGALAAGVIALEEAARENGIPSMQEITQAVDDMQEAMEQSKSTYADTATETQATAQVAQHYIDKLKELEAAGLDADDNAKSYHNTLTLLTQTVPELASNIDLETDTIHGGTAALEANTAAWEENTKAKAYQEQLEAVQTAYADVILEAQLNEIGLTKAQEREAVAAQKQVAIQNQLQEAYAKATAESKAFNQSTGELTDATAFLGEDYTALERELAQTNQEVMYAQEEQARYTQAITEGQAAADNAEDEIVLMTEAVEALTGATQDGADATQGAAAQQSMLETVIYNTLQTAELLTVAYQEVYDAASESIGGQYALWDVAEDAIATSVQSINDALASQADYWQAYDDNLTLLTGRTADIEGLRDMLGTFADGSADSVNAIAGMATASDSELTQMVESWKTVQQSQVDAADGIADLVTDFSTQMDALGENLAADIEAMDFSEASAMAAQATMESYIVAIGEMEGEVASAFARIAQVGTIALANGWTTEPTNTLSPSSPAVQAVTNWTSTDTLVTQTSTPVATTPSINFAPVYNISGADNTDAFSTIMRENAAEMRDFVVSTVAQVNDDATRRAYQ